MADVTAADLQAWAQGSLSNAGTDEELDALTDPEAAPQTAERNAIWAGEYQGDVTQLGLDEAEALMAFLQSEEPEFYGAVADLADGYATGAPDVVARAQEEIGLVMQSAEGYPELTDQQRQDVATHVGEEIAAAGNPERESPEWTLALGIAIAQARAPQAAAPAVEPEIAPEPELDSDLGPPIGEF